MFRTSIQDRYGNQVYVTSRKDKGVVANIYPMPVWEEMERKMAALPPSLPELAPLRRPGELLRPARRDRQAGPGVHSPPVAGVGGDGGRRGRFWGSSTISMSGITNGSPRACRTSRSRTPMPGRCRSWASDVDHPNTSRSCGRRRSICSIPRIAGSWWTARWGPVDTRRRCSRRGRPGFSGLDRDADVLPLARRRLAAWKDRVDLVHADYRRLDDVLDRLGVDRVDGALADLGCSSTQLGTEGRGFSSAATIPWTCA